MLATAPSPEHRPIALAAEQPAAEVDPALGIFNLDHVIFVVQENRSFDHYFGTFPGADGIPQHVCLPDPKRHRCARPYHDTNTIDQGGPHGEIASTIDINAGKMNGFIPAAFQKSTTE